MFQSVFVWVPFGTVLMDFWFATKDVMLETKAANKFSFVHSKATAVWTIAADNCLIAVLKRWNGRPSKNKIEEVHCEVKQTHW